MSGGFNGFDRTHGFESRMEEYYYPRNQQKKRERIIITNFSDVSSVFATKPEYLKTALSNRGIEDDRLTYDDIAFLIYMFESRVKWDVLRNKKWFDFRFSR